MSDYPITPRAGERREVITLIVKSVPITPVRGEGHYHKNFTICQQTITPALGRTSICQNWHSCHCSVTPESGGNTRMAALPIYVGNPRVQGKYKNLVFGYKTSYPITPACGGNTAGRSSLAGCDNNPRMRGKYGTKEANDNPGTR